MSHKWIHTCKTSRCGVFKSLHRRSSGVPLVLSEAVEHHSGGGTSLVLPWGQKEPVSYGHLLTFLRNACSKGISTQSLAHSLHKAAFLLISIPGNHDGMFRTDHLSTSVQRRIQIPALTHRERTQNSCRFRCIHYRDQFTHPPDDVDHVVIWGYRIIVVDCIDNN